MDPVTMALMGGVQAIPDIYNLVTGIRQQKQGKKLLAGLQRPQYEIPKDINTALTLTKSNYADPRFAGQAALENQIGANTANAVQMSYDAGNPMNAISAIQGNSNAAAMQVGAEAAKQQRMDMNEMTNMMDVMAKYKDQKWQMNEFAPYAQKYNEGREQIGAGQTNIATGLQGLGSIASNILGGTIGGMGNKAGGGSMMGMNAVNNMGYGAVQGAGLSQAGIDAGGLAGSAAAKALQSQYYQMMTNMYNQYGNNTNQYFNRPQ